MKSYVRAAFVACVMVIGGVGVVAYAGTNSVPTLQALLEQLRAMQAQLVSLQAAASSPAAQPPPDGLVPARRGNRGTAVIAIQKYLIGTGDLKVDAPTGYFGALTEEALKKLQSRERLPATGAADAETVAKIRERVKGAASSPSPEPSPAPSSSPSSPSSVAVSRPDLTPRLSNIPPVTMAGQLLYVSVTAENIGAAAAPASEMGIFVDGNYAASVSVPAIEPWTLLTVPASVVMGSEGDRSVEVRLNYNNLFEEVSAANNAAILRATVASAAAPPPFPPIGHWKFDGGGADEMTSGSVAEIINFASFQPAGGKYGGYAYIPAKEDSVKIAHHSKFDLPTAFTVEFWLRQRLDRSAAQNFVYKGIDPNYNFRIFREAGDGSIVAGYTAAATGEWKELRRSNQLAHGTWRHIVFTKSAEGRAYYLDGALVYADYSESPDAKTSINDIVIGGSAIDTDFDNLRIYNYALNAAQAAYVYRANVSTVHAPTAEEQLANIVATLSVLLGKVQALFR